MICDSKSLKGKTFAQVKHGANVNAAVNGPHTGLATVLTYGIRSRNKQIIESLIEADADRTHDRSLERLSRSGCSFDCGLRVF